jgi:hypothetical protein
MTIGPGPLAGGRDSPERGVKMTPSFHFAALLWSQHNRGVS